jgi:exodeoxyribonuclease V beta subunit
MISRNFDVALEKLAPGVNLVEAGAGTGKTFAITMLVLRAVAELSIPIEEILVVTFTRAATAELRDRVCRRLRQAESALAGEDGDYDEVLVNWIKNLENIEKSRAAIRQARRDIDRAEISSIHGFCQRALKEHALASGQPPDSELADEKDCQRQAAEDFWRQFVYPLPPWLGAVLWRGYPGPEKLLKSVIDTIGNDSEIRPDNLSLAEACQELAAARAAFSLWWREQAASFRARLDEAIAGGCFKKELTDQWPDGWQKLDAFATEGAVWPEKFFSWLTADGLRILINGQKLRGEEKKDALLATLAPFAGDLPDILTRSAGRFVLALRRQLAEFLRQEIPARLGREGLLSYNELTRRLAEAIMADGRSDAANILTVELQNRYRMALIDEFQDTDIWQWRIFARLFATGRHYLYLIGDPKQAIYRFRGADIFSYFQAGKEADSRLTLTKNFRSHPLLIAEINRLFAGRARPFFFAEDQIAFQPAEAAHGAEDGSLWQNGQPLPVCRYRLIETDGKSQESIERAIRDDCLRQIVSLLDADNPVTSISMENGQQTSRGLTAADIAILTRTNSEAEALVSLLSTNGIAAALDSRASVFASQECQDLLTALTALATPGRVALLARALACDWFGFNGNGLAALFQDETRLGAVQERWHGYHDGWLAHGAAAAILALLAGEAVYHHLRLSPRFERRIANILHLTELLSAAASSEDLGPGQCLEWLLARRSEDGGEDSELNLETDRQSVRILTMHGAKGLEFPVVFCPSLWRSLAEKNRSPQAAVCHDEGKAVVDLGSPEFDEAWARAVDEERAEELRLLYVALTRAKSQCLVFWPLVASGPQAATIGRSPFSYLLAGDGADSVSAEAMRRLFMNRALAEGVTAEEAAHDDALVLRPEQAVAGTFAARQFHGQFDRSWQVASFSSLARRRDEGGEPVLAAQPQKEEETAAKIALPSLPRGSRFGKLIHACLDKMDFAAPAEELFSLAERLAALFGFAGTGENIARLLTATVTAPLPPIAASAPGGWRLADLATSGTVKEMPWSFALKKSWPEEISDILRDEPSVTPLAGPQAEGYLTGFIDLFCEWQGKYYILDYKSNFLGDRQAGYTGGSLVQAMAEHNYGLQYWLYTLAADRWLAWQRPDYDYDRHFGGVYYLFVRGMRPDMPGSGVFATRPDRARLARLAELLGEQR